MTEQDEVVSDLAKPGVLAGITWAVASAYADTMRGYDARRGYKPGTIGYVAHGLICDRMDRVFSCRDYRLPSGMPAGAGMEAVRDGLHPDDIDAMPRLGPDLVSYAPLNNSPGWLFGTRRWLLQSFEFGTVKKIPWARKSETKQRVASHPDPEPAWDLFAAGVLIMDAQPEIPLVIDPAEDQGIDTFVVAHSIHEELGERELFFGRPNLVRHTSWHWRLDLMANPPAPGGGVPIGRDPQPYTPNPNEVVSDAPVRLRKTPNERNRNETSG
ncbi:hypothetical protein OG352_21270 [Streptomyces sp. NBC_01485]|uniref:hypothetical protein n=1 Tax=Streptomyces sp. NBC_01485 TaxID=2903884 RepID=UPI002E32B806|nr:hypothetical protein [Streptomyces sp. NBC_01485]